MDDLTLTCPHCGFTRQVPAEKIPENSLRVTCPRCRESFPYRKPAIDPSSLIMEEPLSSAAEPLPATVSPGRLRGIGELFKDAWEIYTRRVGVLMGLYLLSILLLVLPTAVFILGGLAFSAALPELRLPLVVAGALTGILVGSVILFWGLAALVYAVVDESLGVWAALQRGWSRIWAFAWVFSLSAFIVTGGFLLLVIPGIIFSVWFFLSQFVLAAEDERGMRALLKSKAYVQGRFFDVLLRLAVVWVVSVMIGMVPVLGGLLSLLFVPFMMIYSWLIYDDLRPKRGSIPFTSTRSERLTWVGIGALGFLSVPLFFLLLALGWLGGALSGLNLPWHGFGF